MIVVGSQEWTRMNTFCFIFIGGLMGGIFGLTFSAFL